MKKFFSYIKLSWGITKINVLSQMEYRGAFLSQFLGMFFNDIGLLAIWIVFFHQFKSLNGWGLSKTILLFAVSSFNLGLVRIFAGGAEEIAAKIRQGELDYFLTLPRNLLWQLSVSETKIYAFGDMLFALVLFIFFVGPNFFQYLIFFGSTILSALIIYNFVIAVNAIAFFVGDFEENSTRIMSLFLAFCLYPQTAFSGLLRSITFSILPALAAAWLPVNLIEHFSWSPVLLMAVFWLVSFIISQSIFNYGLSKYESGNLINLRM